MKINITADDGAVFLLDVSEQFNVGELKEILEAEFSLSRWEMMLVHNMQPMADDKPLSAYNVLDGDVILMTKLPPSAAAGAPAPQQQLPTIDWSAIQLPPNMAAGNSATSGSSNNAVAAPAPVFQPPPMDERESIRQHLLNTPHELAILKERNPPLAEALTSGDKNRFYQALEQQQKKRREQEAERIRMLNANPLDPTYQGKIAEDIRTVNVQANMESAIEHIPEMFGQVVMLYIKCYVDGHPVMAFVDSGAQSTIMNESCAERCNIMRLVDHRWMGTAVGVGTQEIVGRVHLCPIQIGDAFLPSSFSILKKQPMDMLLGLDMLKRHQCCIDLKNNVLRIETSGTETPFLAEKDIPTTQRIVRQPSNVSSSSMDEDRQLAEALARSENPLSPRQPTGGPVLPRQPTEAPTLPQRPENQSSFEDENIRQITNLGFSQQQAVDELIRTQGDIQLAMASLLARSLK